MRSSHGTFPAQPVSLRHLLRILVDCRGWKILEWKKGLRRCSVWALYLHDKWGVLVRGRPSLIPAQIVEVEGTNYWKVGTCTLDDLPQSTAEEENGDGGVDGAASRAAFLQSIELTKIFSRIVSTFYSISATQKKEVGCLSGLNRQV